MAMVELRQVRKVYDSGFEALKGVDLEIAARELMVRGARDRNARRPIAW